MSLGRGDVWDPVLPGGGELTGTTGPQSGQLWPTVSAATSCLLLCLQAPESRTPMWVRVRGSGEGAAAWLMACCSLRGVSGGPAPCWVLRAEWPQGASAWLRPPGLCLWEGQPHPNTSHPHSAAGRDLSGSHGHSPPCVPPAVSSLWRRTRCISGEPGPSPRDEWHLLNTPHPFPRAETIASQLVMH